MQGIRSFNRFFGIIPLLVSILSYGQREVAVNLEQIDSMFLNHNLLLLAEEYNIKASEAYIIQAKAYPNPVFTADFNAIDPQNNETFHVGKTGQKSFQIQQLIILGGKRKTEIEMARQNRDIATLEFDDLLRNLRFQLHTSFFSIYRQRSVLAKFDQQLQLLDTLIASYETQAKRGNLPLKDVIRLKSVYLKINNDKTELATEYFEEQRKIQILLQSDRVIIPQIDIQFLESYNRLASYADLIDLALSHRPDLKITEEQQAMAFLDAKLQKKQAIPDVILNGSYDQRGGAFVNQKNIGITIPLPLWNLNRGNIKAAEYNSKSQTLYQQQKRIEVEAEVQSAWNSMSLSIREYNKVKSYYSEDFEEVFRGVNLNFQKRNISILEFVDFFESYNESLGEYERVKNHLAVSATLVNYATASQVY